MTELLEPIPKWKNRLEEEERKRIVKHASDCLWTDAGADALKYLTEKRGILEKTLRQFQVGFVPSNVNHQLNGRIITPIFDPYGALVAVSTRHLYKTLAGEKNKSFWHEDFDKSYYLYGLHIAKSHILQVRKAIVVEGEFDVDYLHSAEIPITVGCCGNALGLFQISLLSRYCDEIYLGYDGDKGGKAAMQRSKEIYDEHVCWALKLIPMYFPNEMDPDDYVRKNRKSGFIDLMKASKEHFTTFGYD
jgi:DNA primase